MPLYEYVCRTCDTRFEARRAMGDAAAPIDCPDGHSETSRVLSVFAAVGRGVPDAGSAAGPPGCGHGCACAAQGRFG
jgi:putative FmdB family regulatory protein